MSEVKYEYTFEEVAGAEKIVAWFYSLGLVCGDTAPRIDNDWAVVIYSTEEALAHFPWEIRPSARSSSPQR
jgi:hypothetical protein